MPGHGGRNETSHVQPPRAHLDYDRHVPAEKSRLVRGAAIERFFIYIPRRTVNGKCVTCDK